MLRDDKDMQKCWTIDPWELFAFLGYSSLVDPAWKLAGEWTAKGVSLLQEVKVLVGLPPFLRRCFMVAAKGFPPIMSATVKSKCWSNFG